MESEGEVFSEIFTGVEEYDLQEVDYASASVRLPALLRDAPPPPRL